MKKENFENQEILKKFFISPIDLTCLKYFRIVSCDVESSFSTLKTLLTDRKKSFIVDGLFMQLIIGCYNASI